MWIGRRIYLFGTASLEAFAFILWFAFGKEVIDWLEVVPFLGKLSTSAPRMN